MSAKKLLTSGEMDFLVSIFLNMNANYAKNSTDIVLDNDDFELDEIQAKGFIGIC